MKYQRVEVIERFTAIGTRPPEVPKQPWFQPLKKPVERPPAVTTWYHVVETITAWSQLQNDLNQTQAELQTVYPECLVELMNIYRKGSTRLDGQVLVCIYKIAALDAV